MRIQRYWKIRDITGDPWFCYMGFGLLVNDDIIADNYHMALVAEIPHFMR